MKVWRFLIPIVTIIVLGSPVTDRIDTAWGTAKDRAGTAADHPLPFALSCLVAALLTVGVQAWRRRRWWSRRTLVRAPIEACDPHMLGVKRSPFAESHVAEGERPPYVGRDLDAVIDDQLATPASNPLDRLILIAGPQLSGKSRTGFETVERLPGAYVIAPKRRRASDQHNPVAEILRSRRRLGRGELHVLWLDDFSVALAHDDVTSDDVTAWLARHPRAWAVATVDASQQVDLSGFAPTLADSDEPPLPLTLESELVGRELEDARRLYPWLGEACRHLPEELVARDPLVARFMQGRAAHPVGAAIVQAAVDCLRCRPGMPVSEAFLRTHHARYILARNSPPETFEEGLAWAVAPLGEEGQAMRRVSSMRDAYEIDPAFVERADRENRPVVDDTWQALRQDSADDVEALLRIANAARDRGRSDIAAQIGGDAFMNFSDGRAIEHLVSSGERPAAEVGLRGRRDARSGSSSEQRALVRNPFRLRPYRPSPRAEWLYRKPVLRTVLRVSALCLGDVVAVTGAVVLALLCRSALFGEPAEGLVWSIKHFGAFAAAASVVTFGTAKLYTEDAQRARLPAIVSAVAFVAAAGAIVGLVNGFESADYAIPAIGTILGIFAVYLVRVAYDVVSCWWIANSGLKSRTVLVGAPAYALRAGMMLDRSSTRPLELLGFVSDEESSGRIRSIADLAHVIAKHTVHLVVLVDPSLERGRQVEVADLCHARGVRVEVVPSAAELQLGIGAAHPHRTSGPVPVPPLALSTGARMLKASFDMTVALALLVLMAIPMVVIAIGIRLGSSGKPIVSVPRPGRNGAPFDLKRFRTTKGLPRLEVIRSEELEITDEPELTGFGRWLRRYKLDELPQLLNVLWGDMSLVGPRPLPLAQYKRLDAWQKKRDLVDPGLTGEWQLTLHKTSLEEMARVEFSYIASWSLARDVAILLRTPFAIMRLARHEKHVKGAVTEASATVEGSA